MQDAFDNIIKRLLGDSRKPILLGISGGIDSISMAQLFVDSKVGLPFALAHVNFCLRGSESNQDEALVREWAQAHNKVIHTVRFDTAQYASDKGISIEMAARELRYDWFEKLMQQYGYEYIAIAHNRNDSVETLYLNLVRGTGLKGLSGIKESNGPIIRPLLSFTRGEIENYAKAKGLTYREDSSNFDVSFHRNRLRHNVFPQLKEINPAFFETSAREMGYFAQAEAVLDSLFEEKQSQLCKQEGPVALIDISLLSKEKHIKYWLFRLLSPMSFNNDQLEDIYYSLNGQSGKRFYSETHEAIRDRQFLKIYPIELCNSQEVLFETLDIWPGFNPKDNTEGFYIDTDKVILPLKSRLWQPADRFRPFGMNKFKKISDFLTDLKLDIRQKASQQVVTFIDKKGQEQIVCVAGLRIDDRYKITESSKRVIKISYPTQK